MSNAVASRRSIRAFLPEPIDQSLLETVLRKALRAPSNSNIQPWHVWLVTGARLEALRDATRARSVVPPAFDERPFPVYPEPLEDPYAARRFHCGERQYAAMDIAREDHDGRLRYVYNNHQAFGAPAAMFLFIDKAAGPSQWADLGIYLQTVMLLLTEAGLDSCAQISWSVFHSTVRAQLGVPDHLTLYCGLSIGRADPHAPVNTVIADRADPEEILHILKD
ncbi:nitroreductase [Sphingobium sp. B1D3A]|uniref:Nitroreductase n=1 Tax=Sphingobium lignivorans TaxID=2735886 RepID=A0ABR6NL20_9SPHN|nr:nitroreductase [Sphingobium lignivorans]